MYLEAVGKCRWCFRFCVYWALLFFLLVICMSSFELVLALLIGLWPEKVLIWFQGHCFCILFIGLLVLYDFGNKRIIFDVVDLLCASLLCNKFWILPPACGIPLSFLQLHMLVLLIFKFNSLTGFLNLTQSSAYLLNYAWFECKSFLALTCCSYKLSTPL